MMNIRRFHHDRLHHRPHRHVVNLQPTSPQAAAAILQRAIPAVVSVPRHDGPTLAITAWTSDALPPNITLRETGASFRHAAYVGPVIGIVSLGPDGVTPR